MNKFARYFNKVQKEFQSKGWDFDKAIGRANPYNIIKNKTTFENFKKRVAKERRYNKEREKIHREYQVIKQRFEAKRQARKKNTREELKKKGYSKRDINKIMDFKEKYGLSDRQILDRKTIQKVASKHAIGGLISEFDYETKEGTKTKKGAFSRFYGIPRIKEKLDQFEDMVSRDKQALHHTEYVLQRFLNETIPLRYEEFRSTHGRYITPPEQFYVDLMDELLHMYSKYVK